MVKTYYSVNYSSWGKNGTDTAWFDDKTKANKFAEHDYRDNPIAHKCSSQKKIADYDELVGMTNFELKIK